MAKELIDFMKMKRGAFWEVVNTADTTPLTPLWEKAHRSVLTRDEAIDCLNMLFLDSHKRIRLNSSVLAKAYPTTQFTRNQLNSVTDLWWVDHFTAGYNHWSTLNWFSASLNRVDPTDGSKHVAGASSHFVMGYHGLPFYIIPLCHGAWHEPARNKDSISIEYVNVGPVETVSDPSGTYFKNKFGKIPASVVQELPPVTLAAPFRGAKIMQPFTQDQIITSIVLKRIVIAALPSRLDLSRMSQHTEWNPNKYDMGPLWPFDECNQGAFSPESVREMSLVQRLEDFLPPGEPRKTVEPVVAIDDVSAHEPASNQEETDLKIIPIDRVQTILNMIGATPRIPVSGAMSKATKKGVKAFQVKWNQTHEDNPLVEDGIPGPLTCACLVEFAETL